MSSQRPKYESVSFRLFPEVLGNHVRYVHSPNPGIIYGGDR